MHCLGPAGRIIRASAPVRERYDSGRKLSNSPCSWGVLIRVDEELVAGPVEAIIKTDGDILVDRWVPNT